MHHPQLIHVWPPTETVDLRPVPYLHFIQPEQAASQEKEKGGGRGFAFLV